MDVTKQKPTKNGKRKNKAGGSSMGTFQMGLYSFGLLALVFLGLSIYAFTRPVLRAGDKIKYQQSGTFFYSASGIPGVYDTGAARAGEPVFTKLTCKLNLGFMYVLMGNQMEDISGAQQFDAMVVDQQSGWGHTIPLSSMTQFTGNSYTSKATLDLCEVQALVASIEQKTGLHLSNYDLVITAHILVGGKISGQTFTDNFEPKLTFNFDSLHFYMGKDASKTDPMKTVQDGTLANTAMVDNTLVPVRLKTFRFELAHRGNDWPGDQPGRAGGAGIFLL